MTYYSISNFSTSDFKIGKCAVTIVQIISSETESQPWIMRFLVSKKGLEVPLSRQPSGALLFKISFNLMLSACGTVRSRHNCLRLAQQFVQGDLSFGSLQTLLLKICFQLFKVHVLNLQRNFVFDFTHAFYCVKCLYFLFNFCFHSTMSFGERISNGGKPSLILTALYPLIR